MAGGDNFAFLAESFISLNVEAPSFVPIREISTASSSLKDNVDLILEKNDVEAGTDTRVRCMEKAKGGIKYDLVLVKPLVKIRKRPLTRRSAFSVKGIPDRLGTMDDHNVASDAQKMNFVVDQMDSTGDSKEKDDTYSSLIRKMESSKENKDAKDEKSTQDKARDSAIKIFEDKKYGDSLQNKDFVMNELAQKLDTTMTTERKMYETLKEHLEKIDQITKDLITQVENMQEQCKRPQLSVEPAEEIMQRIRKKITDHKTYTSEFVEKMRKEKSILKSENVGENSITSVTTA